MLVLKNLQRTSKTSFIVPRVWCFVILWFGITWQASAQPTLKGKNLSAYNSLRSGKLDKAKEIIDQIMLDKRQQNAGAFFVRGSVYRALHNSTDTTWLSYKDTSLLIAQQSLRLAVWLSLSGGDNLSTDALTEMSFVRGDLRNTGIRYFHKQQPTEALAWLEHAMTSDSILHQSGWSSDTATYYYAAIAAERSQKYDKAAVYYLSARGTNGSNEELHVRAADAYISAGDTASAVDLLNDALNRLPDRDNYIKQRLIDHYLYMQNPDSAISCLNRCLNKPKARKDSLYAQQGFIFQQNGDFEKAAAAYKNTLTLTPDFFEANFNLGSLYYNKAIEIIEHSFFLPIEKTQQFYAEFDKALLQFQNGLPYLEKAQQLSPNNTEILEMLYTCYVKLQMYDKYNQVKKQLDAAQY